MLKPILIFLIVISFNSLSTQPAVERILNTFPDWRTNFEKRSIDLNELMSGGPPKDGIPAIINPKFVSVSEAEDWLEPNEPVIFLKHKSNVKAYPLHIII